MIKVISCCEMIIWSIAIVVFLPQAYADIFAEFSILGTLTDVMFLTSLLFLIYAQYCILRNIEKKYHRLLLNLTLGLNIVQIPHILINGFLYAINVGPHILPYFILNTDAQFKLSVWAFNESFYLHYYPQQLVVIGVNVVPLIISILLYKAMPGYLHKLSQNKLPPELDIFK